MTDKEAAEKINNILYEEWFDACVAAWREKGCPCLPGMEEIITEQYNNVVYQKFEDQFTGREYDGNENGRGGRTKYRVMIAVDVPHYATVEIEADTEAEAMDEVEADLEKYYLKTSDWEAEWANSECLRVVDAEEVKT